MKKFNKKSLAVVGLALSLSAAALTGCGTDELEAKVDENASNAEVAINDAATKAADDLAAAKSALEAAIQSGDTANTEALTKAISDLNAAIDAAKQAATTGDETLDAAIKAAEKTTNEAMKALEEDLTAKYTALKTAMESTTATKEELNAKANELIQAMTAASGVADDTIKALKTEMGAQIEALSKSLDTLKQEDLQQLIDKVNAISAVIGSAENGDDTLWVQIGSLWEKVGEIEKDYISGNAWNTLTEVLVKKASELMTAKVDAQSALEKAGNNDAKLKAVVESVYAEGYLRIARALDEKTADDAVNAAKSVLEGAKKIADAYGKIDQDKYDEDGKKALEDAYNKAVDDLSGLDGSDAEISTKVDDIVKALETALGNVLTAEQKNSIDGLAKQVKDLLAQLEADAPYAYNHTNKTAYEALEKAIAEVASNNNAMSIINAEGQWDTLQTKWSELKAAFDAEADALLEKLKPYNAEDYVFVYKTAWTDINALNDEVVAWLKAQSTNRGFGETSDVHEVFGAISTFKKGAYARALELEAAEKNAATISKKIKDFDTKVTKVTFITAEYPNQMANITAMVEEWNKAYFSGDYAAEKDAEHAGYSNYELLDHAAYEKLLKDFQEHISTFIEAVRAADTAIYEVKTPVTLWSQDEVQNAQAKYDSVNKMLEMTGTTIDFGAINAGDEYKSHYATYDDMEQAMVALNAAMLKLEREAAAEYNKLALLKKDAVLTVNSGDDIAALKAWFVTYLGLDITKTSEDEDKTEWPEGNTGCDLGDVVVDKNTFETACTIYTQYEELTALKKAQEDKITEMVKAILDQKACISQKKAIAEALAEYVKWENGTYLPEDSDYKADQLKALATDTSLKDVKEKLDARATAVAELEARRDAIIAQIKALDDTATQDDITAIRAAMEQLKKDNNNEECFIITEGEKTTNYWHELSKAEFGLKYKAVTDAINGAADDELDAQAKEALLARAAEIKKAADALIEEGGDLTIALAELDLTKYFVEKSIAYKTDTATIVTYVNQTKLDETDVCDKDGNVDQDKLDNVVKTRKNNFDIWLNTSAS